MLKTFSLTDIGLKRQLNQDFVFTSELPVGKLPNLFVVADGMGGHKAGELASRFTVETIVEYITNSKETNPVIVIREAIQAANTVIREKAMSDESMEGMGTTVVVATCIGDELCVANVGDSRLYIVNREIHQITRDHSLVEEMVRMGSIEQDAVRMHPDKNIITRAIGALEEIEVDFFHKKLKNKDIILMCTDGLTNMLDDEQIRMIICGQRDIASMASELINAANQNGGKDNIAVIIVEPWIEEVDL